MPRAFRSASHSATASRATRCDASSSGQARRARGLRVSPAGTTGPSGGLTPADITSVYGLSGTGSGQTVAIVDAYNDPKINADLQTFDGGSRRPRGVQHRADA